MPRNRAVDDHPFHGKMPKHLVPTVVLINWHRMLVKMFLRIEQYAEFQREEDEIVQRLKRGPKFPSWMRPKG
jgi:hypothetical protein